MFLNLQLEQHDCAIDMGGDAPKPYCFTVFEEDSQVSKNVGPLSGS